MGWFAVGLRIPPRNQALVGVKGDSPIMAKNTLKQEIERLVVEGRAPAWQPRENPFVPGVAPGYFSPMTSA
jgi:hypothetical protein